jgi:hypothetical protein
LEHNHRFWVWTGPGISLPVLSGGRVIKRSRLLRRKPRSSLPSFPIPFPKSYGYICVWLAVFHFPKLDRALKLVHRLAYNSDVAAGQLAVFQGASEAPISELIRVERATRKNSQLAAAQRVALKMGRRPRCSSVTYRFRYAPSSRLAGGPF